MNEFEQQYYESEGFWAGDALGDTYNRERIRKTIDLIPADAKSLLDVGCGNGIFLNQIMEEGRPIDLFGLDRSHTALKYLKTPNKINGSIEAIPFPDTSFDCVTCLEVIEHLASTRFDQSLEELARVSKKYVIISVPYAEILEERYTRCPECLTIFNSDMHLRSFSHEKMQTLLSPYNFECVNTFTCGTVKVFKGHRAYKRLFFKNQQHIFNAPNCPVCGFRNPAFKSHAMQPEATVAAPKPGLGRRLLQGIKAMPKAVWPMEKKDYWIISLYQKKITQ